MDYYPTKYRLPTDYSANIGRIVTRFAFLESKLRRLTYILLDVPPDMGRLAVRAPRASDTITMIADLASTQRIGVSANLKFLRKEVIKIERFRDKISHGVWVKHAGSDFPVLQDTAGSYVPDQGAKPIKARIVPKALEIRPSDFRSFLLGIDAVVEQVYSIENEIMGKLRTSREKRSRQRVPD